MSVAMLPPTLVASFASVETFGANHEAVSCASEKARLPTASINICISDATSLLGDATGDGRREIKRLTAAVATLDMTAAVAMYMNSSGRDTTREPLAAFGVADDATAAIGQRTDVKLRVPMTKLGLHVKCFE